MLIFSARVRPDYLLLNDVLTARQCLEAFATEKGVEFCKPYPNIAAKAVPKGIVCESVEEDGAAGGLGKLFDK